MSIFDYYHYMTQFDPSSCTMLNEFIGQYAFICVLLKSEKWLKERTSYGRYQRCGLKLFL